MEKASLFIKTKITKERFASKDVNKRNEVELKLN